MASKNNGHKNANATYSLFKQDSVLCAKLKREGLSLADVESVLLLLQQDSKRSLHELCDDHVDNIVCCAAAAAAQGEKTASQIVRLLVTLANHLYHPKSTTFYCHAELRLRSTEDYLQYALDHALHRFQCRAADVFPDGLLQFQLPDGLTRAVFTCLFLTEASCDVRVLSRTRWGRRHEKSAAGWCSSMVDSETGVWVCSETHASSSLRVLSANFQKFAVKAGSGVTRGSLIFDQHHTPEGTSSLMRSTQSAINALQSDALNRMILQVRACIYHTALEHRERQRKIWIQEEYARRKRIRQQQLAMMQHHVEEYIYRTTVSEFGLH